MSQIALGFIPDPLVVPLDKLLPSRKLPENINGTKKYRQIVESLRSIGLIEPLTIGPSTDGGLHILLDGHTRLMAMKELGITEAQYLQVGNTEHHPRLFSLHIGRSGRGRKGDSLALVLKINDAVQALDPTLCPQIHRGGLSSREGLATLIHDGFQHGNREVPAITDKRLWVVESEFANVLQQSRRQGNTLSTALRDCWDGVCIKPATKNNRIFASRPHVCLSGAITPNELTGLMSTKDLSNGFANRFLMIWAERTRITAFPKATPQSTVEHLAQQTHAVLTFANASNHLERNHTPMELSPGAKWHYGQLYRDVLCQDLGNDRVTAILERRAPLLLRLGMSLHTPS